MIDFHSPPRLLLTTSVPVTADAFLAETAIEARRRGWRVDLATDTDAVVRREYDQIFEMGWGRGFRNRAGMFRAVGRMRRLLEEHSYDIVHTHTPTASAITRLAVALLPRQRRPRVFYTAHGFHFGPGLQEWTHLLAERVERCLIGWTDVLIVINGDDERWARTWARGVTVVRSRGVGFRSIGTPRISRDEARAMLAARHGGQADAFIMVSIGELIARKRHELVLEASALMGGGCRALYIVGDGPSRGSLEARAVELQGMDPHLQIWFAGHVKDVSPFLAAADVLVHPAAQEGLPTVILEAMASGVPAVGFRVRGVTDLLGQFEELLAESGDIAGLCAALDVVAQGGPHVAEIAQRLVEDSERYQRVDLAKWMCDRYEENRTNRG